MSTFATKMAQVPYLSTFVNERLLIVASSKRRGAAARLLGSSMEGASLLGGATKLRGIAPKFGDSRWWQLVGTTLTDHVASRFLPDGAGAPASPREACAVAVAEEDNRTGCGGGSDSTLSDHTDYCRSPMPMRNTHRNTEAQQVGADSQRGVAGMGVIAIFAIAARMNLGHSHPQGPCSLHPFAACLLLLVPCPDTQLFVVIRTLERF